MHDDDAIAQATALLDAEITHYLNGYCAFLDIFDRNAYCSPTPHDLIQVLQATRSDYTLYSDFDGNIDEVHTHDIKGWAATLIFQDLLIWDGRI